MEFVQLFNTLDRDVVPKEYTLYSEKYDGMRAIWIPHWRHRGFSGLFSRYARPIYAPKWFTDQLPPNKVIDGELWMGYKSRQTTLSVARRHEPDDRWREIKFMVFEEVPMLRATIDRDFTDSRQKKENVYFDWNAYKHFEQGVWAFRPYTEENDVIKPVQYFPCNGTISETKPEQEGWMFRNPRAIWTPTRNNNGLKYKPLKTGTCTITGYTEGNGRNEGRAGAFNVTSEFGEFKINCRSDSQREGAYLLVGKTVEFVYRELTDDGVPFEARLKDTSL